MFFSFDLCVCVRQRGRKEGPSVSERQRGRVKAKQSKIYKVDEYYDNPNEWSNKKY